MVGEEYARKSPANCKLRCLALLMGFFPSLKAILGSPSDICGLKERKFYLIQKINALKVIGNKKPV